MAALFLFNDQPEFPIDIINYLVANAAEDRNAFVEAAGGPSRIIERMMNEPRAGGKVRTTLFGVITHGQDKIDLGTDELVHRF